MQRDDPDHGRPWSQNRVSALHTTIHLDTMDDNDAYLDSLLEGRHLPLRTRLHALTTLERCKCLDTKLGLSIVALENESVEQRRYYGNSLTRPTGMLQSALLVYHGFNASTNQYTLLCRYCLIKYKY
jgi:hypothetical protein